MFFVWFGFVLFWWLHGLAGYFRHTVAWSVPWSSGALVLTPAPHPMTSRSCIDHDDDIDCRSKSNHMFSIVLTKINYLLSIVEEENEP